MILYIYRGLENERAPKDVTHVIVDNGVTVIKYGAFYIRRHLVSVIMGDNVKTIESMAFWWCQALRFIRISKTLEYIGEEAFRRCDSLEVLFLPSTVKSIEERAFSICLSLRLLVLPHDIDLDNVGNRVIESTRILQIAVNAGVSYDDRKGGVYIFHTYESDRRVIEWLIHHMDEATFHILCYSSSITTKHINDYFDEYGNDSALAIDTIHGMTPLHMLSMNPHAPADAVAALLDVNVEIAFGLDNQGKMSLDYARDYNVGGLIAMIGGLCNHRHSA